MSDIPQQFFNDVEQYLNFLTLQPRLTYPQVAARDMDHHALKSQSLIYYPRRNLAVSFCQISSNELAREISILNDPFNQSCFFN